MTTFQMLPGRGIKILTSRRSLLTGGVAALTVLALSSVANPAASNASSLAHRAPVVRGNVANPLAGLVATTPKIMLAFTTMIGNMPPYIGAAGSIRGIPAGGAPWQVTTAAGELFTNGRLIVFVKDLVIPGMGNPVPTFDGAVSCQTVVSNTVAVKNVFTKPFPASASGQSLISDTVTLPSPCYAPIVFVTSGGTTGQSWFASTGN